MPLRFASRLYIAIHHRSLTPLARSQLVTFSFTGTSFLCINVQGVSNAHHVLVFLFCFGLLGTAPLSLCLGNWCHVFEIRPAASSSLSHSAQCSFVSPGWPSCHLITSASTVPVHWPGFEASRICTTSRPCRYADAQYWDSATTHHSSKTYIENWLGIYIAL